MKYPTRTIQQKNESDSFAILIYKLRDLGIFRNLTQSDYGIDLELELVKHDSVTGRYVKIQVKSSEDLNVRKSDNVPTVSGIKQSTLTYWAQLSYSTHVFAFAVDLKTEYIYFSRPLFWQAISLLNPDNKTKTIEFIPIDSEDYSTDLVKALLYVLMHNLPLLEELHIMKHLFKNANKYIEAYLDALGYDCFLEVDEPDRYRELFEYCKKLQIQIKINDDSFSEEDKNNLLNFDYWTKKSGNSYYAPINAVMVKPLEQILPEFYKHMKHLRTKVLDSAFYWIQNDQSLLENAYNYRCPDSFKKTDLYDWEKRQPQKEDYNIWIVNKINDWEKIIKEKNGT